MTMDTVIIVPQSHLLVDGGFASVEWSICGFLKLLFKIKYWCQLHAIAPTETVENPLG